MSRPAAQRQHVLLAFVGLAAVSLISLWLIPVESLTRVVAARAVALVATLILLRRLVGMSGPTRRAWSLVWAYQALTLLADLVYADLAVLDAEPAFPNPSDVLYLITYAFAFAAVRAFAQPLHAQMSGRLRMELHALIWAGAAVVTLVLLGPWLLDSSADTLTPVVALAYPMLDLLLVLLVLAVLHDRIRDNRSVQLLLGAFSTFLVLDTVYYLQAVSGNSAEYRVLEVGWTAALLMLSFAAFVPGEELTQGQSESAPAVVAA